MSETKKMWVYAAAFALAAVLTSYVVFGGMFPESRGSNMGIVLLSMTIAFFWSRFLIPTLFTHNKLSVFDIGLFRVVVATFTIFIAGGAFGLIQIHSAEAYAELGFFGVVINVLCSGCMATVYSYLAYWWLILPVSIGTAGVLRWLCVASRGEQGE